MRALINDAACRRETGEFVCDGMKLLKEAVAAGAEITTVLCAGEPELPALPETAAVYSVPRELLSYASPLKNSPGPVFALKKPEIPIPDAGGVLVLDGVQDPGNVGTVIRTAEALGAGAVVLVNACADPFGPKAARATMGSIFRQCVAEMTPDELKGFLDKRGMELYGAALAADSVDIRETELKNAACAVGSEGRGLSVEILNMCGKRMIIPMTGSTESLNAAVAASVILWEMFRR